MDVVGLQKTFLNIVLTSHLNIVMKYLPLLYQMLVIATPPKPLEVKNLRLLPMSSVNFKDFQFFISKDLISHTCKSSDWR